MSGGAFTLLWQSLLRSSVWVRQSKETRLVWITLLALKDKDGVVKSSLVGLADTAKVSDQECRDALAILTAPDPEDTSKVDDGRRLREVPGGWQVVNHDHYRFSTDERRALWAMQKAEQRAKAKAPKGRNKLRQMGAIERTTQGSSTAAGRLYAEAEAAGDGATMKRMEEMQAGAPPESAEDLARQADGEDSPI